MITLPDKRDLEELQNFKKPFCLTIYAPVMDPDMVNDPNRIELKNLLQEAKAALLSAGATPRDVKKTLKPIHILVQDHDFWTVRGESLAFFVHPKIFRYYRMPDHTTPYKLSVGKQFNLKPLLKVVQDNQPYFVLALSHKNVRLYKGDHYRIKPVRLKDFPVNMKESLNIDEYPKWRETHSIAPAGAGKGSQAFHGQYNVRQTDKDMLLQFFRRIDKRLHAYLQSKHSPLILAGVGYLAPIYRQVNTYQDLQPDIIKGNVEYAQLDTIREKAWSVIKRRSK